jgi:hypothetical protein
MLLKKNSLSFLRACAGLSLCASSLWAQDLSRGWKVVRQDGYSVSEAPTANAKSIDLDTFRSRAYRLTNFYEPSQLLWLERDISAPAQGSGDYLVLSVGNAPDH